MASGINQKLKMTQHTALSSELKRSLAILNLGRPELKELIFSEIEKNPCLTDDSQGKKEDREKKEDFSNHKRVDVADMREAFSLHASLLKQISLVRLTPYELNCVGIVLQYIDDSGFLNTELLEISKQNKRSVEDLQYALKIIRQCDPAGIGARNVQESLLLQLARIKDRPKYAEIILKDHWSDFEKQNFQKIAKEEKISIQMVKESFRFIKHYLDPKPARQFGDNTNSIVIPDVYVFQRDGKWVVSLNHHGLPRIRLSKKYEKILADLKIKKKDKKTISFLNDNLKSAKFLISCLKQRDKTILKVTETILKFQKKFFEHGTAEYLVPMTLKNVAKVLKMHESTISRSTANKYLFSPQGLFELKHFFNAGKADSLGNERTSEVLKKWVLEFIKAESKKNPLSDDQIAKKIEKEKKVQIARRTVTKYRRELNILSASKRGGKF